MLPLTPLLSTLFGDHMVTYALSRELEMTELTTSVDGRRVVVFTTATGASPSISGRSIVVDTVVLAMVDGISNGTSTNWDTECC